MAAFRRGDLAFIITIALASLPIYRSAAAQGQIDILDQARAVDNDVAQRSPIGSPAFFEDRKSGLQNVLNSLDQIRPSPRGIQLPPDISTDPRYNANLRTMLTSSLGSHPFVFGSIQVSFPQILDAVKLTGAFGVVCSGTLVNKSAVLTAGHCVCDDTMVTVFFGSDPATNEGKSVPAGRTKPKTSCEATKNNKHVDPGNDFGLVWLKAPTDVRPALIASSAMILRSGAVTAVGFGYADTTPISIGAKREADIPIVSHDCTGSMGNVSDADYYGCVAAAELVAAVSSSAPVRKDTCEGDSGGPVYVRSSSGALLLAATTSRGVRGPGGCGNGANYGLVNDAVIKWMADQGVPVSLGN